MSNPYVVAGGIVRNRAWCLDRHLDAVKSNKPDAIVYLTGDNTDNTEEKLLNHGVDFIVHNTGEPGYTRDGSDGPRYNSAHMSTERNLWADGILSGYPSATHLWVVDSDVIPEPDVLSKLLSLNTDVAGANVPIMNGATPIAMTGWDGDYHRPKRSGDEPFLDKPCVASLVGGCYLIQKRLFEFGNIWGATDLGEDGYVARSVRLYGRSHMMYHPQARCQHLMTKP